MEKESRFEDGLSLMSLGEHLDELRKRVFLSLLGLVPTITLTTIFGEYLFKFLCQPYYDAMRAIGREPKLLTVGISESFIVYCNVTLIFGLILAAPWIFWQLWKFISAGLYDREKRYVHIIAPISATLFIGGAVFFIKVVAPMALRYFAGFNVGIDFVENVSTLENYTNFMLQMALVFGLSFQFPLLIIGLNRMGILPLKYLNQWRKYVIFGISIVAAILTPPDVVSQVALGVPLYVLYEAGVLVCWVMGEKKKPDVQE